MVVECKTAARIEPSVARALRPLQAEYGERSVVQAFIACRTEQAYPLAEGAAIEAVPLAGLGGLLGREELM